VVWIVNKVVGMGWRHASECKVALEVYSGGCCSRDRGYKLKY